MRAEFLHYRTVPSSGEVDFDRGMTGDLIDRHTGSVRVVMIGLKIFVG